MSSASSRRTWSLEVRRASCLGAIAAMAWPPYWEISIRASSVSLLIRRLNRKRRTYSTFVIKNHPFADGNKRIASLLFVEFLPRNRRLARGDGPVINDVGLAALALLVAESDPRDKDVMIRLVMNMLAEPAM